MKIGLYISSQCKSKQSHFKFAQLLFEGLKEQINICTPQNILTSSFDIIHILAGRDFQTKSIISTASHNNIPILYSPLGEFQPWGKKSSFTVLKNTLRVQKQLNNSLKFIHAWSKAEQKYLLNFTNKSKLVYIPNAIITNNITSETMCNLFNKVYQKIVDTYVNIVIDPQIKKDIFTLLQINLNQNHQHKTTVMTDFVTKMQTYTMEQWRLVFLLAYNQGVLDYLNAALDKIGIHPPKINVQQIEQFNLHKQNTKFITENISIDNPEKKIYCEFANIIKARECGQDLLSSYILLYKLLYTIDYDENKVVELLLHNHLLQKSQQLISDMQSITGLTEGFIPTALSKRH